MVKSDFEGASGAPYLPAPGEGKRGADGHIAYLLRQASAAVRHRLEQGFSHSGVTLPQFTVMTMLKAYPGISGADLARLTLLTPQTINVIVANLLRSGAIARQSSDRDRRALIVSLTASGEELLAKCREIADGIEARLVANLADEDEAAIRRWLAGLVQAKNPDQG